MKKILLSFLATLLLLSAAAKPVDPQRAAAFAARFLGAEKLSVRPYGSLVVVSREGGGFVILAADDVACPLIAYSPHSPFDAENLPPHVEDFLRSHSEAVQRMVGSGQPPSAEVRSLWDQCSPKSIADSVPPLLSTTWDQAPYYNRLCPYTEADSVRRYAVAGCVATATAQIMKYYNHPPVGHGSKSYQTSSFGLLSASFQTPYLWDSMPASLSAASTPTEVEAVAKLIYHVGVAVEMRYGVSSSGAYVSAYGSMNAPSAERALRENFAYSPSLHTVWRSAYTDDAWDSLLAAELSRRHPVLYTGRDTSAGHAFVLDGYQHSADTATLPLRLFHINWGWGGMYDGWYSLDSLAPGAGGIGGNSSYTFNLDNGALLGIVPSVLSSDSASVRLSAQPDALGSVGGSGNYAPYADTLFVSAQAAEGSRFVGWTSGRTDNPFYLIPNGDYTDTALFLPLQGDTLFYCSSFLSAWADDYGDTTTWAIRLPPSVLPPSRALSAAQIYIYAPGTYTLSFRLGTSVQTALPLSDTTLSLSLTGWNTVPLPSPLRLPSGLPLWLICSSAGEGNYFPAAMSAYSGAADGVWYKLPEGWQPYDAHGVYYTWMLRALFSDPLPTQHLPSHSVPSDLPLLTEGRTVRLADPADAPALFLDSTGRLLSSGRSCTFPSRGVYIVRSARGSAARILIL